MAEHELKRSIHTTDFRSTVYGLVFKAGEDVFSHSVMCYHQRVEAFGNLSIVSQNMSILLHVLTSNFSLEWLMSIWSRSVVAGPGILERIQILYVVKFDRDPDIPIWAK